MSDKIAEIRERHKRGMKGLTQTHHDRTWLLTEVEKRTRQRDEARYFLKIFVHAHANNNAVPPHIEEQARKALEAKP